jgi:hypothetical protein
MITFRGPTTVLIDRAYRSRVPLPLHWDIVTLLVRCAGSFEFIACLIGVLELDK